jgi:hypothetical protein
VQSDKRPHRAGPEAITGQSWRKTMPRLTLRIDFDADRAIGPGKIKLLEMIDEYGSISEAGRQMGMSYRRAWLLVDSASMSWLSKSRALWHRVSA